MNAKDLRRVAVSQTLFGPTSLASAIERLGFVQADPIRAPARAQDLILRHRVRAYRAGDLELRYPQLDVEEGVLFAYGFLSPDVFALVRPATTETLSPLEARVLDVVREHGPLHPSELHRWFGSDRVLNDWGGQSRETTSILERLRRFRYVRVVRRDVGVRVYAACSPSDLVPQTSAEERCRTLIGIVADILGPVPEATLSGIAARLVRRVGSPRDHRTLMRSILADGLATITESDGLRYWTPARKRRAHDHEGVKFLAPFDPIVWDRRRFEHLWGWPYRFEAYVPVAKRARGYYALPLLWHADVIGWANVRAIAGVLEADIGYVTSAPRDRAYKIALAEECERMEAFLLPRA